MPEVVLEEPATLKEAFVEIRLLRKENEFLKRQLEVAQTFQAKMGLILNKILIGELFDKKIQECKARDLCRTSIYFYEHAKIYFLRWCKTRGLEYADEITIDHTHEFWNWFKTTPGCYGYVLSESSRLQVWKSIKSVFQFAEERNSIIRNPFKNKVVPVSPVDDWWDDEYYYALIDAIRKHAKPSNRHRLETIVRCLYTTGLRVSLFLGAKNRGVRIDGDRLYVTTKRKVPKTSSMREITIEFLNSKSKEMYMEYVKEGQEGYVLINDVKPSYASDGFRACIRRVCKKAGMPYKAPHKAKHGFITKMLRKGYTAEQICEMTGNFTPELISRVYNHIKASDFRDRVKADLEDV